MACAETSITCVQDSEFDSHTGSLNKGVTEDGVMMNDENVIRVPAMAFVGACALVLILAIVAYNVGADHERDAVVRYNPICMPGRAGR